MGVKSCSSLPGLTRQSIHLREDLLAKEMDARVISAFTRVFDALLDTQTLPHRDSKEDHDRQVAEDKGGARGLGFG